MSTVPARPSWRDHLPVHPAADLFPLMSESELQELAEDIKAHGQRVPIAACKSPDGKHLVLLDGRNRFDAMALTGLLHRSHDGFYLGDKIVQFVAITTDPYEAVLSLNIHRRHLTSEQKRDLIDNVLKAKPEASDRQIAKLTKTTNKTVAKRRRRLESTEEIPQLEETTGADGKKRKSRRTKNIKSKRKPVNDHHGDDGDHEHHHRATGSAEVSEEQHRADMARLDEPSREAEINALVDFVLIIIRRQFETEALSRRDAERYFAALQDRIDIERERLRDAVEAASSEAA